MYGVPADLDLSHFVGATLEFITLAKYQVVFHFEPAASVSAEGRWCLVDCDGNVVDESGDNGPRETFGVQRCIGQRVIGAQAAPPDTVSLTFESGHVLRFVDDSPDYESFHLDPGDIHI